MTTSKPAAPWPRIDPIMAYKVFVSSLKAVHCSKRMVGRMYVFKESETGDLVWSVGPHWYGGMAVVLLVAGGTTMNVFLIDSSTTLMSKVAAKVLVACLCASTLALLFLTACSDPGVVRTSPVPQYDTEEAEVAAVDASATCEECNVLQLEGLGIRHCYECGVCVEGHDHHCPWMTKCIGKKNFRYFVVFNLLVGLYMAELIVVALCYQ